jgi:hypothetical protein
MHCCSRQDSRHRIVLIVMVAIVAETQGQSTHRSCCRGDQVAHCLCEQTQQFFTTQAVMAACWMQPAGCTAKLQHSEQ